MDPERKALYEERAQQCVDEIFKYHVHPELKCVLENVGPNGEARLNYTGEILLAVVQGLFEPIQVLLLPGVPVEHQAGDEDLVMGPPQLHVVLIGLGGTAQTVHEVACMPYGDVFTRINREYYQLTSAEKKIADYMLLQRQEGRPPRGSAPPPWSPPRG